MDLKQVFCLTSLCFCLIWSVGESATNKSPPIPLLVVSLDGMRADKFDEFVQQNPSSNFARIINNGLKADYMIPIYPTLTFPNHFTLVTGNKT